MNAKLTSGDILRLLEARHSDDVFVPECKDGPTQGTTHFRLDAWVMNKSWRHPRATGYEIKISRSDFLRDIKWPEYLPLCNEFFFVAPKGLISVDELDAECGLMEVVGTSRLMVRRRPEYRDVTIPEPLYRYVLMCRAKIGKPTDPTLTKQEIFRAWLAQKAADRRLGYEVSRAVREKVYAVQLENESLKARYAAYDDVRRSLECMGFSANAVPGGYDIERRVKAMEEVIPQDVRIAIQSLERACRVARESIDAVMEGRR
jgi:hypothetical protein